MINIISTKNLTKSFGGVKAVDGLSIEIEKGKITGIIGPNGSGKSTLVNVLTGVTPITNGSIVIDEKLSLQKVKPHDVAMYSITRTFQDIRLFNQMTALDNILVVLTERGVWSSLFEHHSSYHLEKAQQYLDTVNLWHKRKDLAGSLSYGQRKLLEIARALAMNAEVILFDEPFAGLFPEIIKLVIEIMKQLRTEGKTVVLIEHNMALIKELSDTVIVLDSGSLLTSGNPEEVLQSRKVIEAYLGE